MTDFLQRLRAANTERVNYFGHGALHDGWNVAEWGCALGGECGELLNLLKKMNRSAPFDPSEEDLLEEIGEEVADVVIYLDLISAKLGIDIEEVVTKKFNGTSEKYGFDVMIPTKEAT